MTICILNAPQGYPKTLGALPLGVKTSQRLGKPHTLDLIHFFTTEVDELDRKFDALQTALHYDGSLWISWPKRTSKVKSDLNENIVRELGLQLGLVDVKVAAVDETWSGLKFVYRVANRPKAG